MTINLWCEEGTIIWVVSALNPTGVLRYRALAYSIVDRACELGVVWDFFPSDRVMRFSFREAAELHAAADRARWPECQIEVEPYDAAVWRLVSLAALEAHEEEWASYYAQHGGRHLLGR